MFENFVLFLLQRARNVVEVDEILHTVWLQSARIILIVITTDREV